jgi:hypothetical protein
MGTTHYGDFFAEKRKKQVATITDNYFLVMDCSLSDKIYNKKKNVFKVSLVFHLFSSFKGFVEAAKSRSVHSSSANQFSLFLIVANPKKCQTRN